MPSYRTYDNSFHFEISSSTINGDVSFHNAGQNENERLLPKLPFAEGAAFNSRLWEHESRCLPETRVNILQQIITWSTDPNGACIFWLNGIAGTGKSTIARTVANTWSVQKQLGASFFFSKGQGDLGHATYFFTSLADQLAISLPDFRRHICSAIKKNPDIFQRGLGDQWKHLILQPLSKLEVSLQPPALILVIDALDECDGDNDTQLILRLLAEAKNLNAVCFRVFITSRPETPIRFGFHAIPEATHQDFVLHSISQSIIEHDISIFLHHELDRIRRERGFPIGWPSENEFDLLCQRACGLFIYASTACRFIRDLLWTPYKRLSMILNDDYVGQSPTGQLDDIYIRIIKHSINLENQSRQDKLKLSCEFKQIVGSIIILFDTLPITMVARLLNLDKQDVEVRLSCLRSVFDIPEMSESPIRLLHPSFRDFLLHRGRCLDTQFRIDETKTHGDLFVCCLKLMSKHLKRNICNLGGVVKHCLPLDVQYSCCYWVSHLQRSNIKLCDGDQVHIFLQKHFLHWLEALSLIGKISDGILMVKSLETILTPRTDANHDLNMMVYDGKRFVLKSRSVMEVAPLQIYSSALMFSPMMNRIRCHFWDQTPHWIKIMPAVQENWNMMLQSLEGHSHVVEAVAFSPDRQLIASASDDRTVRFWDPSTGASRRIIERHSNAVSDVVFSPNGQFLATASRDKTVRLWDSSTGASRGSIMSHPYWVNAVAFSADGQLLASASFDNIVRLWDPSTGTLVRTLKGHSYKVYAVAFSLHGQLLASASSDKTIRLWDSSTGASRSILKGHSEDVFAVAFQPVGQFLASSSHDKTVRLWDPSIGALRGTLEGHSGPVRAVAFTPNGQLLASASDDKTVKLWDPSTGALLRTLEGHSHIIFAVAFSPDGQLLVSGAADNIVRLWDLSIGAACGTLQGHSDGVCKLVFSPGGQLLASASYDHTVKLWDPSTGALLRTLEGHSHVVFAVAFSSDGRLLASGSRDETVRLWDLSTGASCSTLEGHRTSVQVVAFSPDSQLLASASKESVMLWDPSTGALCGILGGHTTAVDVVAFSPDCKLVASAYYDKTVRLWDIKTKETIQIFDTKKVVKDMSFSKNGSYLKTSQGIIEFKHLPKKESRSQSNSSSCQLGVTGNWLKWGTKRILWLPPDYRAKCHAVRNNVLAMGHASGKVTFIEINLDTISLD